MMTIHGACPVDVILVSCLCKIESLCHFNLSYDRLIKIFLLFCYEILSYSQLLFSRTPYSATILSSNVRTLAVYLCWVMNSKESLK